MQTFTDLYRYRFVLSNLIAKDFKVLYRNMALGFFWSILNPLVLVTVLSIVWVVFFQAGPSFPSMVLVALIPYTFTSYCLNGCAMSVVTNAALVKKVAFPRQILPVAVVLTHMIHFGIQASLIVVSLIVFPPPGHVLAPTLAWLPLLVCLHLGLSIGVGLLVSALNVVYRDMQYIVESSLTVLFWMSPILYDAGPALASKPAWVHVAYYCNPLAGLLDSYRAVLYWGRSPALLPLGMSVVTTLALGVWGVRSFWVHEKEFADLI